MVGKIKKERKILVTGSSGMLGTDLIKQLGGDYYLTGVDLTRPKAGVGKYGRTMICDLTKESATADVVSGETPDLVIHCAAWTFVDGCEQDPKKARLINVEGTRNIANAASKAGCPIVFISTDFVFDGAKRAPYSIDDKPNPLNVYAATKLEGEQIVLEMARSVVIRTSWLYGVNGANFVDTIVNKARAEKSLRVVDDQIGSPTYSVDLARAVHELVKCLFRDAHSNVNSSGIYHISNKGTVSWFDYARTIVELAGIKDVAVTPIKSSELNRPAKRPVYSALDTTRFETYTKTSLRNWKDALKEYLDERK